MFVLFGPRDALMEAFPVFVCGGMGKTTALKPRNISPVHAVALLSCTAFGLLEGYQLLQESGRLQAVEVALGFACGHPLADKPRNLQDQG